ncbi:hypothetical protein [Micromonospora sp. 4G55]|uniref:ATP-dependent DNA ligase n=1 Tax=Micromonospora sp. 4G55 TaxID=2806102 RepID=UPI0021069AB2|nr:hypothetical protein [Micromonospora sp. 4G55]
MLAKPVETVPTGHGLSYEPKWDGWRALAFRHQDGVYLQSRAGRDLGAYFPDVLEAVNQAVAPGAVLDGELVVWAQERTDFSQLQRRVTAGTGRDALARSTPPTTWSSTSSAPRPAYPCWTSRSPNGAPC